MKPPVHSFLCRARTLVPSALAGLAARRPRCEKQGEPAQGTLGQN